MVAEPRGDGYRRRIPMRTSPTASGDREGTARRPSMGWGGALLGGLVVVAASVLGFAWVPNLLINHTFVRTAPRVRDPLVLLWIVVVFVLDSWLLVGLQRFGGRGEARG